MKKGRYEFILVLLLCLSWGFLFLDMNAITFIFPVIVKQLHINMAGVGQVMMFQSLGYAVFGLFFSMMADISGSKKWWLVIFVLIGAVFSGVTAFTATLGMLLLIRFITGSSEGPVLPLAISMISAQGNPQRFAFYCGLVAVGGTAITAVLGPIIITQLVAHFNWHFAFLIACIPSIVLGILLAIYTKDMLPSSNGSGGKKEEKASWRDISRLIRSKNVVLCFLLNLTTIGVLWILIDFGPLYWVEVGKMSEQSMGLLTSALGVVMVFWEIFIPLMSNRLGRKTASILFAIIGAIAFVAMAMLHGNGIVVKVLFVGLCSIVGAFPVLFEMVIIVESVPAHLSATGTALMVATGGLFGAALVPRITGSFADAYGLPVIWTLGAILLAVAAALAFALTETRPRGSHRVQI